MGIEVMVVNGQPLLRRGLVVSLNHVDGFGRIEESASVPDAWANPALGEIDVVLLDASLDGAVRFVTDVHAFAGTQVLALGSRRDSERVDAMISAGASAGVDVDGLSAQALVIALRAVAAGMPVANRTTLVQPRPVPVPGHAPLSEREQRVLSLVADGLATRTVALELHYSERTVKKVLGDVVVKLGARSRSHAIAHAVREGLI